jgi:hypothetical protein
LAGKSEFEFETKVLPAWIWAAQVADNQTIYLRRLLNLKRVPRRVNLYVTADNHFILFINGHRIAATSDQGPHPRWAHPLQRNVAGYLRVGRNIFAIRAHNDSGPAGVILWMLADRQTLLKTDGHWRVAGTARGAVSGTSPAFSDSHWPRATVEAPYGSGPWGSNLSPWPFQGAPYLARLYFQPLKVEVLEGRAAFRGLSTVSRRLTAVDQTQLRPGYAGHCLLAPARRIRLTVHPVGGAKPPELLLNFGQEVSGRIEIRGQGGTAIIGTGESRGEAIHRPWGGWHKLPLTTGNTRTTPWSAFRYAVVKFTGAGPITVHRLRLNFDYYPVKYRGAFDCSDPLLTKIWYTGAYTAHLCMQQQIWDAPKRDRAMWMGDLQVSGEVINNVFLDHFLMELTMRDLRENAQGGRPNNQLPVNNVNGIPGYSCAWIVGLSDFYRHSGALAYLKSQHQLLLSMLRYLKRQFNHRNVFDNKFHQWCFVDWAPALVGNVQPTGHAPLAATDLYACLAARRGAELLAAMGDQRNAHVWQRWAVRIAAAARRYLVDPKTNTFTNTRQVNAMAIYAGVANAQQRRAIYKTIFCPHCAAWKQIATPYYNYYVISALGDLGRTRQAMNFVRRYWGGMIREGATTFWEVYQLTWPQASPYKHPPGISSGGLPAGVPSYTNSLCHGWSSGVTSWLTEYVLGVRPSSGGFASASIVPHLGGLSWVIGRVPTPHGSIVVKVKKTGKRETLAVTLPKGVRATVGVPGASLTIKGVIAHVVRRSPRRSYIRLAGPGRYVIANR